MRTASIFFWSSFDHAPVTASTTTGASPVMTSRTIQPAPILLLMWQTWVL